MCNEKCVPAVYIKGKKKGQIISCSRQGRDRARRELTKRDGPCPPDKDLCRHTCDNDSTAPNGFVCVLHTVWGTYQENKMDQPEEKRKICGKKTAAVVRTCPYCGRTIRGPGYFQHERACKQKAVPPFDDTAETTNYS